MTDTDISPKARQSAADAMAGATAEVDEQGQQATADKPKTAGMASWVIVAAAVPVVLAGVGGAGFWWMNREPSVEMAAMKPVTEELPQFLKMDALTISIRRPNGTVAPFTVVISLDLTGGEGAANSAKPQIPRLRDAFLQALTMPPLRVRPEDGRASLDEVKTRLLAASRSILGEDAVRNVLIETTAG
jgi:flagellar basal body-associated protein FliL